MIWNETNNGTSKKLNSNLEHSHDIEPFLIFNYASPYISHSCEKRRASPNETINIFHENKASFNHYILFIIPQAFTPSAITDMNLNFSSRIH